MPVLVTYFFQGQPGESMDMPNAFMIPHNDKLTLEGFLSHFPLPYQDSLHFRFQKEDPVYGYVWADINSKSELLPHYHGHFMAKILKTDDAATVKRASLLRKKSSHPLISADTPLSKVPTTGSVGTAGTARADRHVPPRRDAPSKYSDHPTSEEQEEQQKQHRTTSAASARMDSHRRSPEKLQPPQNSPSNSGGSFRIPPPVQIAESKDMLDFNEDDDQLNHKPSKTSSPDAHHRISHAGSRSGSRSGSASRVPAAAEAKTDLSQNTMDRSELQQTKEDAINKKVQEALDAKIEQDRKEQQEQQDFDIAKQTHEQKLLAWSTNNKEKRNIRSLLSTMHTVLWAGTRWKSIGLGDLLEPQQVKKQYRKAMLVVHPDHCVTLSNEQKFISKRVFEAVNEAYNEFLKKESVS